MASWSRATASPTGRSGSSVAATSSQVSERLGIPSVSGESEATPLTERGYKYFFRTTPNSDTQTLDFWAVCRTGAGFAWARTYRYLATGVGHGRIVQRQTCHTG